MATLKCDICLEKKNENPIKCNDCEFSSHEECLVKWFSSCNNYLCPHCKKKKSYNIDYDGITFSKEDDDDISAIINMMSNLDMQTIIDILNDTMYTNINNQQRRNRIDNGIINFVNEISRHSHNTNEDDEDDDDELPELGSEQEVDLSSNIINPVFSQLPLDIVVSEILKEGQLFAPETFISNFNKLPIQIRAKWDYTSVKMEIDGRQEIIAYKITKSNDILDDS